MNLSPSIDLIWRIAADEMAAAEFREIQPEHFCMALLKFAEVSVKAPQDAGEQADLAKVIAGDAQLFRDALQECGIESTAARRKLRSELGKGDSPYKGGKIHRSAASRTLFEAAFALAEESGAETVTPLHLLTAMVQSPTPAIAQAVLGKAAPPPAPAALQFLEKRGQDLVKQAAEEKSPVKAGIEVQSKAVLQALQHKDRRSVLLITDDNDLAGELAAALASVLAAKDAPEGLKGRRLMDVSQNGRFDALKEVRASPKEQAAELERMRQLFTEAAAHPEVILLVPAVEAEPKEARGGQWTSLFQETLSKGKLQFICRVTPSVFTEHLRKDPVWKRQTQAVWLEKAVRGSVPREL